MWYVGERRRVRGGRRRGRRGRRRRDWGVWRMGWEVDGFLWGWVFGAGQIDSTSTWAHTIDNISLEPPYITTVNTSKKEKTLTHLKTNPHPYNISPYILNNRQTNIKHVY